MSPSNLSSVENHCRQLLTRFENRYPMTNPALRFSAVEQEHWQLQLNTTPTSPEANWYFTE